jgi:hypothetical protein
MHRNSKAEMGIEPAENIEAIIPLFYPEFFAKLKVKTIPNRIRPTVRLLVIGTSQALYFGL